MDKDFLTTDFTDDTGEKKIPTNCHSERSEESRAVFARGRATG
jgi:hypothetical protein